MIIHLCNHYLFISIIVWKLNVSAVPPAFIRKNTKAKFVFFLMKAGGTAETLSFQTIMLIKR